MEKFTSLRGTLPIQGAIRAVHWRWLMRQRRRERRQLRLNIEQLAAGLAGDLSGCQTWHAHYVSLMGLTMIMASKWGIASERC